MPPLLQPDLPSTAHPEASFLGIPGEIRDLIYSALFHKVKADFAVLTGPMRNLGFEAITDTTRGSNGSLNRLSTPVRSLQLTEFLEFTKIFCTNRQIYEEASTLFY